MLGVNGWWRSGVLALGLVSLPLLGQSSLTLTSSTGLEFGEVVVDPSGGSITLDASTGQATPGAGIYLVSSSTHAAALTATGPEKRVFQVLTTTGTFQLQGPAGGTISVSTAPLTTDLPLANDRGRFPNNPGPVKTSSLDFHIGGPVNIPGGLPAGDYNGVLPVFIQDTGNGDTSGTVLLPVHIRLIAPIALLRTQDLDMGIVVPGSTSGSVTLNPATGAQGVTGGVLYASGSGQPAQFSATGEPNHAFSITLGSPTVALSGPGGTMSLSLTASPSGLATFNGSGTATLSLGGTLSVGANQAEGDYLGTFTVTVAYP